MIVLLWKCGIWQPENITMSFILTMTYISKLKYRCLSKKYFFPVSCVYLKRYSDRTQKESKVCSQTKLPLLSLSLLHASVSHSLIFAAPVCVWVCVGKAKVWITSSQLNGSGSEKGGRKGGERLLGWQTRTKEKGEIQWIGGKGSRKRKERLGGKKMLNW